MMVYHHRGFSITIYPEYEETESRLARGDWQSKVIGYHLFIRCENSSVFSESKGKLIRMSEVICETEEQALDFAETIIDDFVMFPER